MSQTIIFRCPNPQCGSRALEIGAETETTVIFDADGMIAHVEYGEWYITPAMEASCPQCHWQGHWRNCMEAERPGVVYEGMMTDDTTRPQGGTDVQR